MLKPCLKIIFLFFACTFITALTYGQGTSNKGKEFWVAYQAVSDDLNSRLTLFITSNTNANVNIDAGGQTLPVVNINAGQAVPVVINPNIYSNTYISGSDALHANAGIHITSDVDIIVYCHISNSARSASSLILPVKALGNEYYAISYTQSTSGNRLSVSEFTLVGVEASTTVEITPVANSIGNTKLASNGPFQIVLNKGDVYQYQSNTDLTGSKIKTVGGCKPLAVFSGSTFIAYCEPGNSRNAGTGDPLYQQLFPTSAWGQNFITAPFFNAQNGTSDIIRVQVAKDNTIISVNGSTTNASGVPLHNPYAAGSVVTFATNAPSVINANAPISVAQLQVTQACNINNLTGNPTPAPLYPGDPELTILNPIEQILKDITVYSAVSTTSAPTAITKHYLNIILKTLDIPTLTVDGAAPSGNFRQIDNTYSFITIDVTASSNINPAHRIRCENGFVAIAYGYGNVESYAYLAGADLKNLNAGIDFFTLGGTIQANSLCFGEDYNAKLKLPYITNQIIWDFNNGVKKDTILNPTYTAAVVNSKTFYYYNHKVASADLQRVGNHTLKATVLNPNPTGCDANEDVVIDFEVSDIPVARFDVDKQQICGSDLITFTDRSDGKGKNIAKWFWDFGDGSNIEQRSNGLPFTHLYVNPGDYKVKLYVLGETDCASYVDSSVTIHVAKSPEAKFLRDLINCENQVIKFSDASVSNEGNIISWHWDFGDAASAENASTNQNPTHTFRQAKSYDVSLTVTTDFGCTNTIVKPVVIHALPIVDFETPDICLSDASATFINKSSIADGTGLTYVWDFGDTNSPLGNNTSAVENPSHIYTAAKVYQVTLTATSVNGCVTTLTKPFTVNGSTPKAKFTELNESNLCSNQQVVFEDLASVDFGEVTKIDWIYDTSLPFEIETDEDPATRAQRANGPRIYKHTYPTFFSPAQKTVDVTMKAYSGISCANVFSQKITLKAIPKVDFSLPDGCLPNGKAAFTSFSTFVGSEVGLIYHWEFGDALNSTSDEKNPTFEYTEPKDYQVSLTVTAPNGCSAVKTQTLTVKGAIAQPTFSVLNENSLCSNQEVVFVDDATIAFGEVKKIEWYFDNDHHANDPQYQLTEDNPSLRSASHKNYSFAYPKFNSPATLDKNVKMVATSGDNCVSEIIKTITLKAVPSVEFLPLSNVCEEVAAYQLTQASETSGFNGLGSYSGSGIKNASGLFSPAKAGVGAHLITYTFVGDNGCSDTKTQSITVMPTPTVDAGSDKIILTGGQVILDAVANGNNITYKWTPAIGLDKDDVLNPVAAPLADVTYTLTIKSEQGCTIQDSVFVKVLQFPEIPNTFTPNGDGVNDTWNIKYLDSYPNSSIKVFNRYGKEVFSTKQYKPWDGKVNNEYLPEGMYYYIITAKDGQLKYSGSLLLVK